MNADLEKKIIEVSLRGYLRILHDHGIEFISMTDAELHALDVQDLRDMLRQARDLARTPTS